MKVAEIREILKKYDQKTLIELFVNAYKAVPKSKKETLLDPLIVDYTGAMEYKKASSSINITTIENFDVLEQEIDEFIEDAYAQNYFAPNKKIPKAKRPKWRFMVKNYVKQLIQVKIDTPYYERSVTLLYKLYKMLCYGCHYYIFSTEDPFRSVGIIQQELYHIVAERTFATGYTPQKIKSLILLAISTELSREALNIYMYFELLSLLKTADLKYTAIKEAKQLISEKQAKYKEEKSRKKKVYYNSSHVEYEYQNTINELAELIMLIQVELGETMEGIPFFYRTYIERDKEITMYCLLRLVDTIEDDRTWKQVYEDGIKRKIQPRDSLCEKYESLSSKS